MCIQYWFVWLLEYVRYLVHNEENYLRLLNQGLRDEGRYVDQYGLRVGPEVETRGHDHDYLLLRYFLSEQYILILYIDEGFRFHRFPQKLCEIRVSHHQEFIVWLEYDIVYASLVQYKKASWNQPASYFFILYFFQTDLVIGINTPTLTMDDEKLDQSVPNSTKGNDTKPPFTIQYSQPILQYPPLAERLFPKIT